MPTLDIALLGPPSITLDGEPLVLRPRNSARAKAILFYLAASGRPETRERLAGLLWSDWPEKKARDYLRGELFLLNPLKEIYWVEQDGRLALRPDTCQVDLALFRALTATSAPTLEALDTALQLWRGDFLEGFASLVENSSALYAEWLYAERLHWEGQRRQTLYRLAETCARTRQRYDLGIAASAHLLALEPEREEVHRLKMRLLALDGQRTAALKQYDECTAALLDELGVPPSAEINALYDQIVSGDLQATTPLSVELRSKAPPFQAPAPPAHFVGRDAEREQLAAWLATAGRGATVAIVGMGGVGKTALAAETAGRLRHHFSDGVLWARVATDNPLDILQSWALAYDKDLSKIGSPAARAAAMRAILADKHALIVLDDITAGRAFDLLLPGIALCPVLVTTRDRAEVVTHTTHVLELFELTPTESMQMLTSVLGEESVQSEQAAAIALCTTLGGLPLAVEIAAQRLAASPRRSLTRMVRSLQDAGERLAHGISNRSVRTSFTVSWEAMPAGLRRFFALTGVCDGHSFTPPALAAAAQADLDHTTDQLEHLVTLSMLKLEGADRYVQHRLLADFAREKLAEQPDMDAARLRYATFYRDLAQRAANNYNWLEPEWENLIGSVESAHQLQAWGLVTSSVDVLTAPWFARARFAHARQGFRWGLDAATALGDENRKARYAYLLAKILLRQDDYGVARQLLGAAIDVFTTIQDQPRLADAYIDLADVAIEQDEFAQASTYLANAEQIYIGLHSPVGLATVKSRQALVAFSLDRHEDAQRLCEEGLAALPEGDGAVVRSRTLRLLTDLALYEEHIEEAVAYCFEAQQANQAVNDPNETAALLYAQAKLDHYLDNHTQALVSAERSAQVYASMGDRKAVAIIQHSIGLIHLALTNLDASRSATQVSLEIARALNDEELIELCTDQLATITRYAEQVNHA